MANKLKGIFSNDTPEYRSTLKFKDSTAYQRFCTALQKVEQEGHSIPIEGVDSISMYMQLHGLQFPIDHQSNISKFMIAPSKEHIEYQVIWDGRKKVYNFEKYHIASGIVLETDKKAVVYMKLIFSMDSQKVKITYQLQYEYAKSLTEIEFEMNACISFLTKFYFPTIEQGETEEVTKMDEIFRYLRSAADFVARLCAVEKELGLSFSANALNSITAEDQQDVEELYLLLYKKIPLRLNAKINSTDTTNIEVVNPQTNPIIGNEIGFVFHREVKYELLGQNFAIFTANALINAVIKDVQYNNEKITVFYGDTETKPMYVSFSGFLTEEQAIKESNRNISADEKYINARTCIQYIKEYYPAVD